MEKKAINERKRTKCERYSRIVGYLRPLSEWNVGKQQEFKDRVMFDIKNEKTNNSKQNK